MTETSSPTNLPAPVDFIEAEYGQDEVSQAEIIVSHPANRELLRVVSNILMEAKHHSQRLEAIFDLLRTIQAPAPMKLAGELLDTFEQHHHRTAENIEEIRTLLK